MNTNFSSELFECSFLIVSLLLKQYNQNSISRNDFINHTKHKIEYINSNLKNVNDSNLLKNAQDLIDQCSQIIST